MAIRQLAQKAIRTSVADCVIGVMRGCRVHRTLVPLLLWWVGLWSMYESGANFLKTGTTAKPGLNEAPWIDANVEAVKNYLQNEFEKFSLAHQVEKALDHIFTVHDGKKRFKLFIGWPILADRSFTQPRIDRVWGNAPGWRGRLSLDTFKLGHSPVSMRTLIRFTQLFKVEEAFS